MIRKSISLIAIGVFMSVGVFAQNTIKDGIDALYNGQVFRAANILKTHVNDPLGAYWLAQTYIEHENIAQANDVIAKAPATDPFILAAKGQLQLIAKKPAEAKQSFDAAIAASNKNNRAEVLNAVGKAIAREFNNVEKIGDINFAVEKLKEALAIEKGVREKNQNKKLLADISVNLGDALRKQNPGEGSEAYAHFQNALTYDPTFAQAEFRKALIFKSQRNYQSFMEFLDKAIAASPAFLPAYYQQYEYWISRQDFNSAQLIADRIKQNAPGNPNIEYYAASTYYFNKKYDEAIASAKNLIATAGDLVDARAYKVIAYSLIEKKDTAAAIPFVEEYFKRQTKDNFMPKDYTLKAMAYSTTPGKEQLVFDTYLDAVKADSSLENKIEILETGAEFFGNANKHKLRGDILSELIKVKPESRISLNDYWFAANAYFNAARFGDASQYENAWKMFDVLRSKYSNRYGYLMTYRISTIADSINTQGRLVADADKLIEFSKTDTAADAKNNIVNAAMTIATYYINEVKDNQKGLPYLQAAYDASTDPAAKEQIKGFIDMVSATKPKGGR